MKRKIIPLIMASMCATACAFGLAACGNTDDVSSLRIAGADGQLVEELTYNITYGETPELDYKVYVTDQNGGKKEVNLNDDKLTVEYYYSEKSNETIETLPDEYLYGSYVITYNYESGKSNFRAYVRIEVAKAESDLFRVEPERTTWYSGDVTLDVALKNPKGLTVQHKNDDDLQPNDTNGVYSPYMMKKSDYDALTDNQKTDYDYINELYANPENPIWLYLPNFVEDMPVGEYMLFASVEYTHNYTKSITPAVKINIKDTFIERTFTLQSITVQDDKGNPVTDDTNEFVLMSENMSKANQGKTLVCNADGELRGTVDLGNGAFDELSATDVYKYETYTTRITLTLDNQVVGNGEISNGTLTIKMPIDGNYYFILTFISK